MMYQIAVLDWGGDNSCSEKSPQHKISDSEIRFATSVFVLVRYVVIFFGMGAIWLPHTSYILLCPANKPCYDLLAALLIRHLSRHPSTQLRSSITPSDFYRHKPLHPYNFCSLPCQCDVFSRLQINQKLIITLDYVLFLCHTLVHGVTMNNTIEHFTHESTNKLPTLHANLYFAGQKPTVWGHPFIT